MTLSPDQKYMVDKIAERAFPGSGIAVVQPGMTLRDYFAGQALAAGLTHYQEDGCLSLPEKAAANAYMFADAMLKEREK